MPLPAEAVDQLYWPMHLPHVETRGEHGSCFDATSEMTCIEQSQLNIAFCILCHLSEYNAMNILFNKLYGFLGHTVASG
jgi:hypothetical protein